MHGAGSLAPRRDYMSYAQDKEEALASMEEQQEQLGIGGFRVSTIDPHDRVPMTPEAAEALLARVHEVKLAGNVLYQSKDWGAAVQAYSAGLRQVPDFEEVEMPVEARQACAVLYTNRSAARYALGQHVGSLSDAQCAQQLDPTWWKAHWRVGSALLKMEPRVERSEQMIAAFELCVNSPTLPEAQREKMGKYLENAKHRLKTGKDKYAAADCALM